jgi:Sec-independent protein translocase protein TatA
VLLLIVWIVVVVLALVVLGAIAYGLLGAAGRLRREMDAAERDARPLLEQIDAAQAAAQVRDRASAES